MKKILKNFKDLIFRHKILSLICLVALIIIIFLIYMFCSIFVGGSDKYGNRLNGIEEVALTKKELASYEEKLEEYNEVDDAGIRLQGKIVYFDIEYTSDTSKDKAKEIASKTLEEFTEDELNFYDFEYILTQNRENEEDSFKITGTKSPKIEKISWIKS